MDRIMDAFIRKRASIRSRNRWPANPVVKKVLLRYVAKIEYSA